MEGAFRRKLEHVLGHEQRDIGHHACVRLVTRDQLLGLRRSPGRGPVQRQALRFGELGERIARPPFLVRCRESGNDVPVVLMQPLENGVAKGLLAMHDNPQPDTSPSFMYLRRDSFLPRPASTGGTDYSAAWEADSPTAPAPLIRRTSASE